MIKKSNLVEPDIIYKICNNIKTNNDYMENIKIVYKKYLEKHIFLLIFIFSMIIMLIYRYNYKKNKKENNLIPNNLSYDNILKLNNLQKK